MTGTTNQTYYKIVVVITFMYGYGFSKGTVVNPWDSRVIDDKFVSNWMFAIAFGISNIPCKAQTPTDPILLV